MIEMFQNCSDSVNPVQVKLWDQTLFTQNTIAENFMSETQGIALYDIAKVIDMKIIMRYL